MKNVITCIEWRQINCKKARGNTEQLVTERKILTNIFFIYVNYFIIIHRNESSYGKLLYFEIISVLKSSIFWDIMPLVR
jgi:hypothetical protein